MMYKYSVLLLQVIITLTTATDSSTSDDTCQTISSVYRLVKTLEGKLDKLTNDMTAIKHILNITDSNT